MQEEQQQHLVEGVVLDRIGRQPQGLVHLEIVTSHDVQEMRHSASNIAQF